MSKPAWLVLADGTVFKGHAIGSEGNIVGEVVFNTAMTGYQEIITDPSYAKQIVTLTYPHIGNVGINLEDSESERCHLAGLIIRDLSPTVSNWRASSNLVDYLKQHNIIGLANIDTRKLTRILREHGAQHGCITTTGDIEYAQHAAQTFPGLDGMDLAKVVSTKETYVWREGSWQWPQGNQLPATLPFKVVVYDFGVKRNILRLLVDRGCELHVVPATTPANEVFALKPHGVVLSNGPGDPAVCHYAIESTKQFLAAKLPVLGICLGYQILALACGAQTQKMKFGHHGANHPVQGNNSVFITSQNHGFAVKEQDLPANLEITHRSLFDGTLQGLRCTDSPAFGFQGHPEASPGPHDVNQLFDQFIHLMK
ncbi:MAG: glutamine-hydrolyzing carbamoyl-phosphate synthase small subunit [Gammaproteobacteria bacterium]